MELLEEETSEPLLATAPNRSSRASPMPGGRSGNGHGDPFYCSNLCSLLCAGFPFPAAPDRTQLVGYTSGTLFALGWWLFIDGVCFAATRSDPPVSVPVGGEDFVPGILATISLITVNLINKETLTADDFSYSGGNVATKARACAFVGITMALGAIIGAISIMCVKYIVPGVGGDSLYFGITIPLQSVLIFASSMTLWFLRNGEDSNDLYGF